MTRLSKQLVTLLCFLGSTSLPFSAWAQDPLHTTTTPTHHRNTPLTTTLLASSSSASSSSFRRHNKPWRRPRSYYSSSSSSSYYPDYSSHFIDWEECRKDRRSRLWQVDFKTRKVGQLSVTSRLVWTNVIAFMAQVMSPNLTKWGIKLSERIMQGQEMYRLVTPIFLHGGLLHLGTNMISLQRVGGDVEKLFGSGRYLVTYVAAGVAGNVLSAMKSPNPSLGASGAVFGIVGAYFVFLNRNDWLLGSYGQSMTNAITQTIAMNIFLGAMNPVIDNWSHLGGVLGGAAMAYFFGPRLYLAELPDGGRAIVDRPIVRTPRSIEAFPDRVGEQFQRIIRRMQIGHYKLELPDAPWRQKNRPIRVPTPNRSIKPQHTHR